MACAAPLAYVATLTCIAPMGDIAASAQAATLRTMTTLQGPRVKLSDLFDDAGVNANRVLGPGPAPGGRIVVEAAQLSAIAHQFDVDWRPSSSADRAVLDWPGQALAREAAMGALRDALTASGVNPENCEIDLSGFAPPVVPLGAAPKPLVSQLDYDRASGRFSAVLSVTADGLDPISTRITGRVDEMTELPVAVARLAAGSVLRAEDVRMARVRAAVARQGVAHLPADAIGRQLRHQVAAGQPLVLADLMAPELVHRGAEVQMQLDSPGILLIAQGQAMESGAAGERIHVLNPVSHVVLEAEVIGAGRVRIAPGSGTMLASARANRASDQGVVQ